MTLHDLTLPTGPAAPRRYLPVLLVLFVGSGCAALIYEVVWLQLLQLVIGSTAVSLGVLLGTFMGGMCAGSLLLPRLVSLRRHPLRVYALLELGIGAIALVVLFGMPYCRTSYVQYAVHGSPGHPPARRWPGSACCPPTLLMGATLPGDRGWVETGPRGVVARFLLRRQHRGGRVRLPARRILPAACHDMATAYVAFALNDGGAIAGAVAGIPDRY
jgi:spermidine synthase